MAIVQKEILTKLREFGLNSYESRLWTALLSRGVSTAGELSDIANVPRSRTYDVLESLEKKGFVIMKLGKPIKYLAIPPSEVVDRVKKRVMEEAETQSEMLDKLRQSKVLAELVALHTQGIELVEPHELSGAIKGRENLYNHMESMIKGARKSILIMSSEEGIGRKLDVLGSHLQKAKSRGVDIKVIAPVAGNNALSGRISKIGELKSAGSIGGRFVLVDGNELLFMLSDAKDVHPAFDSGVWVGNGFFAKTVEGMFRSVWESG